MRKVFKLLILVFLLALHCLLAAVGALILPFERQWRNYVTRLSSRTATYVLELLGVHVFLNGKVHTHTPRFDRQNYLVVANHLSYLDVLILMTVFPAVFITSVEVEMSPVLGTLARATGSLFVERRSKAGVENDIERITALLKEGHNVVIFPEGTTGAGRKVLPFKKSLLEAALQAGVPVLPFCLNYRYIDGEPINSRLGDRLFYYGDMQFFPHLWSLLGVGYVWADLAALPEQNDTDRKSLADRCHHLIAGNFTPVLDKVCK